ncbi:MAG TPA: hypothetical protein VFI91_11405, partial [Longimicrobiaceae bacterium]|nr:hypothetical protein [Longimicrobiaceae bacterium]
DEGAYAAGATGGWRLGSHGRAAKLFGPANESKARTDDPDRLYGPALDWIRGFSNVKQVLQQLNSDSRELILEQLRESLAARSSGDGVWLASRAWLVRAARR